MQTHTAAEKLATPGAAQYMTGTDPGTATRCGLR